MIKKICIIALAAIMGTLGVACKDNGKKKEETPPAVLVDYIAKDGKTDYTIVLSGDASEAEKYAADELQKYVAKVSGVTLPVKDERMVSTDEGCKLISIGDTDFLKAQNFAIDYDSLNGDGFVLKTKGKSLFIDGDNDRGTLYGVYDFLEKNCGIRFLDIGVEHIPAADSVALYESDIKEVPAFHYRANLSDATFHIADQAFAAKTRTTHEFCVTPPEAKYGGTINMNKDINQTHNNLTYIFQDSSYAGKKEADKVTYFDEWEKRKGGDCREMFYFGQGTYPIDICYSNGINEDGSIDKSTYNTATAYVEGMKKYVTQNPAAEYYMCGQEDITSCCGCSKCGALAKKYGTTTATILRFYNAIAREMQAWADTQTFLGGKELKIVIFSYYFSAEAPVVENADGSYSPIDDTVVVADNITIRFADITANSYFSFLDDANTTKVYGSKYLEKWKPLINTCWYWGYTANHTYYFGYLPTLHKVQQSLLGLADAGCEYALLQNNNCEYNDWKVIMEHYVCSKMLWDPTQDVNALRHEFITLYFGAAAQDVEEIVVMLDEWFADVVATKDSLAYANLFNPLNFPKELWENTLERIEIAQAKATGDERLTADEKDEMYIRIERMKVTPLFSLMWNRDTFYADNALRHNDVAKDFFTLCADLGIVYYGEHRAVESLKTKYSYN